MFRGCYPPVHVSAVLYCFHGLCLAVKSSGRVPLQLAGRTVSNGRLAGIKRLKRQGTQTKRTNYNIQPRQACYHICKHAMNAWSLHCQARLVSCQDNPPARPGQRRTNSRTGLTPVYATTNRHCDLQKPLTSSMESQWIKPVIVRTWLDYLYCNLLQFLFCNRSSAQPSFHITSRAPTSQCRPHRHSLFSHLTRYCCRSPS